MGKIVLLVPTESMRIDAHNYCQQHPEYQIMDIRCITTETAVAEARKAQASGADLVIARGLQASLIQKYTDIPVVQMVITAQEMALLIQKAKNIAQKANPVIAVVGITNMFCDMSYFNELYNIDLRTYFADSNQLLERAISNAVADRVDVIIGGERAVDVAYSHNIPSLFLSTTDDSLSLAMKTAVAMDHALTVEKKNAAEMATLLDYSYSGVIRSDAQGIIRSVNPTLEQMVDINGSDIIGKPVVNAIPGFPEQYLQDALNNMKENAIVIEWNRVSLYTIIAPIVYENHADGTIITLHRTQSGASRKQKNETSSRFITTVRLDDITHKSAPMQTCIDMAKLYALSDCPLILLGEAGTERRMIAEGIHCAGSRKNAPFLDVSCSGLSVDQQTQMLFGDKGAVAQTQGGTLLIQDLDTLSIANQYRLYQLIRFHVLNGTATGQLTPANVRVMVTSRISMKELLAAKHIREDLYYLLAGLELEVPPLRERPEDLAYYLDTSLKKTFHTFGHYHVLTAGARKVLQEYSWPGNIFQIERFCERLILTSRKRSIDEIIVSDLLREMYGDLDAKEEDDTFLSRREEILAALKSSHGNREKTAEQLGISTTTLWRQMKKYGIEIK